MINCPHVQPLWPSDLEFLRTLRNESRQNFFDTREISPEAQQAWHRSLSPQDRYFIIWLGSSRVGAFALIRPSLNLRLPPGTPIDRAIYLSTLLIHPDYRGQGILPTAVRPWLCPPFIYLGYVRVGNQSSLRACQKLGLQQWEIHNHPTYGPIHCLSYDPQETLDV